MRFHNEPSPEERGDLDPPKPPVKTAVGIATPPPPRPPRRRWAYGSAIPLLRPVLASTAFIAGGVVVVLWPPFVVGMRVVGWISVICGIVLLSLLLWLRFVAAPLELWRERRRIRAGLSQS